MAATGRRTSLVRLRLTSRLVALVRSLARAPDTSLPQALPKWSELKAAYRFFDNAKAVPDHILFGHIEATRSRLRTVPIVLAVQDTTYLNWEHHPATQGLGRLSVVGCGAGHHLSQHLGGDTGAVAIRAARATQLGAR